MCQKMDTLLSITFKSNQVPSLTTNNVALTNGLAILAFSKISAKAYKKRFTSSQRMVCSFTWRMTIKKHKKRDFFCITENWNKFISRSKKMAKWNLSLFIEILNIFNNNKNTLPYSHQSSHTIFWCYFNIKLYLFNLKRMITK